MKLEELLNEEQLRETRMLLHKIRTRMGIDAYLYFKKVIVVAAHFANGKNYIRYNDFLNSIRRFLKDKPKSHLTFFDLDQRAKMKGNKLFGIPTDVVVRGTMDQVLNEVNKPYPKSFYNGYKEEVE